MEAILKFILPEEQDAFEGAIRGADYRDILRNLDRKLRNWLKYGDDFNDSTEALEEVRTYLLTAVNENGLHLWD